MSCEHYNLHYHLDEDEETRGTWGDCMYPHKMNLDDVGQIEILEASGKLRRRKVWGTNSCNRYMSEHCYGDW